MPIWPGLGMKFGAKLKSLEWKWQSFGYNNDGYGCDNTVIGAVVIPTMGEHEKVVYSLCGSGSTFSTLNGIILSQAAIK